MNRKNHYIILLIGILIFLIGIVFATLAEKSSSSIGGKYLTAESNDNFYYLIGNTEEIIEISKDMYIYQNTIGYGAFILIVFGSFLIFIFFVLSTFYRIKYKDRYR